jgi:hypothetical protein
LRCLLLQSAVDGMVQLLPDLPELRPQLQALLGPQVDALDRIVAQASRQAVDAAAAASQGALLGLGSAMTGITTLLKDAQFQVCYSADMLCNVMHYCSAVVVWNRWTG